MNVVHDPFASQLLYCRLGRTKQQRRKMVGNNAVDLLRHAAVETAQPSLHVRHRNVQLDRCQCAGEGRIGIAVNTHAIRPVGHQDILDFFQHSRRLRSLASRSHAQAVIRTWQWKLLEENVSHPEVIVLSGIQQQMLYLFRVRSSLVIARCRGAHHRHLYELGPNSGNGQKFFHHHSSYWFSSNCSGGTSRQILAGAPSTTLRAGTSRVTIDPAATRASSPKVSPGRTVTLAPMRAPRFIVTPL